MTKNKLLLLLALLLTAATGAWGMQIYISYPSWPTGTNVNGDGNLVLEMEASDSFENLKAKIEDKTRFDPTYMHLFFNDAECADNETLYQKSVTANSVLTLVYDLKAVKLADGTLDADKWTITPAEATTTGVAEGTKVTLQYTGRLKVKSVTATTDAKPAEAKPALSITSPSVGQVIGSDGKNYAYGSLPTGVTAVAKICYVSGSNGLAMALTDEESKNDWSTAQTVCAAHTAPFTGGTWKLATKDEWDNMINAAGSYSALHDGFSSVGGTNMQEDYYWSSTEYDSDFAWYYDGYNEEDWDNGDKEYNLYVRACLAFTVEQSAKDPATVTTAPTGAAIVGVGKTTALVSGGAADGGTMMYKVTTENTKPASTDGFSEAVPTAQGITASGKVYVWYYVKGDDTHSDSEIAATAIEVTVKAVPITVTWNPSDIVPEHLGDDSFTKDGITFTAATCDFQVLTFGGGGSFTNTIGNFTKIEISADFTGDVSGTGWSNDGWQSATWTGNAASVSFSGDIWGGGMTCEGGNLKIVFTIE